MNNKRIYCSPRQIKLLDCQFIQLLQVALDSVNNSFSRPLQQTHNIRRNRCHDGTEEQGETNNYPGTSYQPYKRGMDQDIFCKSFYSGVFGLIHHQYPVVKRGSSR